MKAADVLIIGGGIMGCSLAYNLALRGTRVTVLEKTTCGSEASGRNSSGVRAQMRDPKELPLAMYSQKLWRNLSEELDFDVEYRRIGNLAMVLTEERLREFKERVAREQAAGLRVRMLTLDEIKAEMPCVDFDQTIDGAAFLGGSLCDDDGTADPIRSTLAFAFAARRAGAQILTNTKVTGICVEGRRIVRVETTNGVFSGGVVVNAAGPWAPEIGRMAGVDIPITPYLDQVCISQQIPENTLPHCLGLHPYGFWKQTKHGNLIFTNSHSPLDQFPRHDVGYDVTEYLCHMTAKLFRKIGLAKLALIRAYSGWNEVSPDGCAMIGFAGALDNFFINAGYSGHGFCLGPGSGVACADLILDGKTDAPVADLAFSRFEQNQSR